MPAPRLSRRDRDLFWEGLRRRFPEVPAAFSIRPGDHAAGAFAHGASILTCPFSLDGTRVFGAGGGRIPGADSRIRSWDVATGEEIVVCEGHVCGIYEVAVDPRSGILASASEDYSVVLWNLELNEAIFLAGGPPVVKSHVAFAADRPLLAFGESEAYQGLVNALYVIDLASGQQVFHQDLDAGDSLYGLALSRDGDRLAFAVQDLGMTSPSVLVQRDLARNREAWRRSFPAATFGQVLFLEGTPWLAATLIGDGENDKSGVRLIEAASGEVLAGHDYPGIGGSIAALADGGSLACVDGEGVIALLRLPDLRRVRVLGDSRGAACSISASPDGRRIAAGYADGRLRLLDL